MDTPPLIKFAIIIPVYNVENYLRECLDSIKNQTYPYFEVFMVDDGSTDESGKICDEYVLADDRFHVIHQKNSGVSVARNQALDCIYEHARKFQYISFVDADDWVDINWLNTLVQQIDINVDLIVYGYNRQFVNSKHSGNKRKQQVYQLNHQNTTKLIFSLSPYKNQEVSGALLCTKTISIKYVLDFRFDTNLSVAEDVDFLLQLLPKIKSSIVIREKLYQYRQRRSSASNINQNIVDQKLFYSYLQILEKIVKKKYPKIYLYGVWNFMFGHMQNLVLTQQLPSLVLQKYSRLLLKRLYNAPRNKILWLVAVHPIFYRMYAKYRKYNQKLNYISNEKYFD